MKKLVVIAMVLTVSMAGVFADKVISPDRLPQQAKDFISTNFPGKTTQYVEAEFNEYEVHLSDGTEIKFTGSGEWEEVKSYTGVPTAILPSGVTAHISQNYPDVIVIEAEKDWRNLEVQLSNRMKMYFDNSGNLIGQKYDH